MKGLDKNWLTTGLMDFEYKKYTLLSYLQEVEKHFNETKLYPPLADLLFHYQNLLEVREHKQLLEEHFPKEISRADFEKFQFVYKKLVQDDAFMEQIEAIIGFALPAFKKYLVEGRDIYQYIEENLRISPIGIVPLQTDFGYLFVLLQNSSSTQIFEYQITIFENATERYRGIHLQPLGAMQWSLSHSFENMKIDLIRNKPQNPNPATYLIESSVVCPLQETLLPVAKRSFVKYIST